MIRVCSITGRLGWWACLSDGSGVSREVHAPFCERPEVRFLRPTLLIVLGEDHLRGVLKEYVSYFNISRPHQGIQQSISIREADRKRSLNTTAKIVVKADPRRAPP